MYLRKLADDRAEQIKFRYLLSNKEVTVGEVIAHRATFVAVAPAGRHALAIQDSSEINCRAQRRRKRRLGTVGDDSDIGLSVHPVLVVDALNGDGLGLIERAR